MSAENMIVFFDPESTPCEKVIQYSRYYNIPLTWKNINEEAMKEELVAATGQESIPALVIPGEVILGEDEIVKYIMEHYAEEENDLLAEKA